MEKSFEACNQVFVYDQKDSVESVINDTNLVLVNDPNKVSWLNVYGFHHTEWMNKIIEANGFDDFLKVLFKEDYEKNKMIDLDEALYLSINVMIFKNKDFDTDLIRFVFKDDLILTIQEKEGDYFDGVREYIRENKGIIRKKGADYLLFKLLEAIIENYEMAFNSYVSANEDGSDIIDIKPDPKVVLKIEKFKNKLLAVKTALLRLREVLLQLENWDNETINFSYFNSLRESANFMIEEIDMKLQLQESKLNLIFNIQSHRLNEVMKTLTIFSVVFIPLTFLAGIYGMNFDNIPELHNPNGYFILLSIMLVVVVLTIIYFRRKKWF